MTWIPFSVVHVLQKLPSGGFCGSPEKLLRFRGNAEQCFSGPLPTTLACIAFAAVPPCPSPASATRWRVFSEHLLEIASVPLRPS
jgi:hypothetical protein